MDITAETRRESYEKLDDTTFNRRIVDILQDGKKMTAREIAVIMHAKNYVPYPVRQAVAPRLTELESAGVLEVCGKAYDDVTQRHVAVYRLVEEWRA